MKAVVMAAGKGTRMMPLTSDKPKVLIEANGKPFLYYVLSALKACGINEIAIIAGYKKEKIFDFLSEYDFDCKIIDQDDPQGTGQAVGLAKDFAGEDDIIVLGGDNLWSVDDIKNIMQNDQFNYIAGIEVKDPSKYGILVVENSKLVKIHEKPKEDVGNLANTGLYKFTPEIFDALSKIELSERGEYELTDAITMLAEQGKVKAVKVSGFWLDMGCPEDIPKVEKALSEYEIE